MPILWRSDYESGIQTIDLQHQALFTIINDLERWFETLRCKDELKTIFERLESYIIFHFGYEENMMRAVAVRNEYIAGHLKAHEKFSRTIQEYGEKLDSLTDEELRDLHGFLADWLTSHILNTDKKLHLFLNE